MKTLETALYDHMVAREGIDAHVLAWIEATDIGTGDPAPFGLWTGDDDRTFTIDGDDREYLGAGSLIGVGPLVAEAGYVVRVTRMSVAHLQPDVADLLATRNLRHMRCTWHQAHLAPGSFDLVAPPRQVFKGRIERTPMPDAEEGGQTAAEFELVSYARDMTLPLTLRKSHESLIQREPGDTFRQYIAVSGRISTVWGEESVAITPSPSGVGGPSGGAS